MLQTFTSESNPKNGPKRLALLRAEMRAAGLDGWIAPRSDAHQGEYVAPGDERLAWLTGFTGSAGTAYVTADRAALVSDGRYKLQGRDQCDACIDIVIEPGEKAADWLRAALPDGGRVGFDPWLHTPRQIETLDKALTGSGIMLEPHENLIDRIWTDRPAPPAAPARLHPGQWAGESSAEKRARLATDLRREGHKAVVLTLPDSICWLMNIRGADIERNPLMQGFAVMKDDGQVTLYTNPAKLADIEADLGPGLRIRPDSAFAPALRMLAGPVRIDPASAPVALFEELADAGVEIARAEDPCILPKARKNPAELAGMRAAHIRDGAAMVEFLCWLDAAIDAGEALTEISVVQKLEGFRAATGQLNDLSFNTICGTGPHGAIMHYRVTEDSNLPVRRGEVLLVDSGGQYPDGTTDITRTLPVGDPSDTCFDPVRTPYTRVLQGLIAVSRLRFPKGLAGRDIDAVARAPLWMEGFDYDHGTGHGVGAALSVHEGPARIARISEVPLEPGMILSNEPGYYRPGAFGIRLENLIAVQPTEAEPGRKFLGFETLTLCPFDRRLLDLSLMTRAELDWLNAYHAQVRESLEGLVSDTARDWLTTATAPL